MRLRAAVIAGIVVALLAGGGAAYVLTSAHDRRDGTAAHAPWPSRPSPLSDLSTTATSTAQDVARRLQRAMSRTGLGQSIAGLVIDATSGTQLFARQATQEMAPASTLKLFTAAAALTVLGPNATLTTGVARSGDTIYLVGGGDVTLTATSRPGYPPTASLSDLARRTAAALGDATDIRLRYDASQWSGPTLAPGWTSTYLSSGNVSRLSPLELDEARLTGGATAPRAADPARQAADAFSRALAKGGVHVHGDPRPAAEPPVTQRIAAVTSPTVGALVQHMLTTSDNDLAEALGRMVARQLGRSETFAGAAASVRDTVVKLGVPASDIHIYDASGLSRLDRVNARALVMLLRFPLTDATLAPVLAGLPVAGFSGTLADRYGRGRTRAGAGVVRAKTGTLAGVNALAGQVVDVDGQLLLFAFIADHVPAPAIGESALDGLAAALARCGCSPT